MKYIRLVSRVRCIYAPNTLDPNIQLTKDQCSSTDDEKATMSKIPYREVIRSFMWAAVATQPDIAFAVSLLSQFLENPGEIHWKAVKRIMRYLNGTKNYKLTLPQVRGKKPVHLETNILTIPLDHR